MIRQQTRDVQTMLVQCWASDYDDIPTLYQHWLHILCLLEAYAEPRIMQTNSYSGLMMGQRRRLWSNFKSAEVQWLVFAVTGAH